MAKTYGPGVVALVAVVAVAVVVAGLHFGYYNPVFAQQWNSGYTSGSAAAPSITVTPCSLDFTQNATSAGGNASAQIAADGSCPVGPTRSTGTSNSFTLAIENSGDEACSDITILCYNPTTDDEGVPTDLEDADDYFEVYVYDGITYTPVYKESEYKAGYSLDLAEGSQTTLTIYVHCLKAAAGTFVDGSSYTLKFWVYQPYADYAEKVTATLAT